jgi:hypothetical protein
MKRKFRVELYEGRNAPGYWRYETSGVLAPAVEAYIKGEALTHGQVMLMKMYLRQWIMAPCWRGDAELEDLRWSVELIQTQQDIRNWLWRAMDEGHDPL